MLKKVFPINIFKILSENRYKMGRTLLKGWFDLLINEKSAHLIIS